MTPEDYAAENEAGAELAALVGGPAPQEEAPGPSGETDAPQEGQAEQPTPQLWAGKYKTAEDLEQAYSELQSKLGQQGSELGQEVQRLRYELDQVRSQPTQYQQPQPGLDEDTYEDLLDEDPQRALAYAQQAGDTYRAAQALKAWYDADAYSATEWRLAQERQMQAAQFQQQLSGYETHVQNQQLSQAFMNVAARHPDLPTMETELAQVASENQEVLTPLQTGTLESKERVIEALYALAILRRGGQPATGAQPQEAPHVATTSNIPPGRPAQHNPVLDSFRQAAEEMTPEVLRNWGQIPGR